MAGWFRLLAFVPMVLAARIRRIERRTIARLKDAGANTAERAILLESGGAVAHWVYRRLQRAGALEAVGDDRYYLNAAAFDRFRARRKHRAFLIIMILLIGLMAMYFRGDFS